jgi:predicted PurR-regulated permease PerM
VAETGCAAVQLAEPHGFYQKRRFELFSNRLEYSVTVQILVGLNITQFGVPQVPRVVSFIVLVAILLFITAMFFKVMAQFVLPLFLAAVLVVVFKPLHMWVREQLPGRLRLSALVTTALIMLVVLVPTAWLGWNAYKEGRQVFVYLQDEQNRQAVEDKLNASMETLTNAMPFLSPVDSTPEGEASEEAVEASAASGVEGAVATNDLIEPVPAVPTEEPAADATADALADAVTDPATTDVEALGPSRDSSTARPPSPAQVEAAKPLTIRKLYDSASGTIGHILIDVAQGLLRTLFALVIMILALYYFLVDGPTMIHTMMRLSPLENEYERELLDKFANVSRAVVVAALASAVAQGLLAGIGFYFALDSPEAPVFLLTMVTMVLAVVPFVGAAGVWIPTSLWIYFYQGEQIVDGAAVTGDPFNAIALAVYSACVVSTIDNVIKPLVLHGQSNLHPLLALMSILGGVKALGPVGILVGPMLVAFVHALLVMVNKELRLLGRGDPQGMLFERSPAGSVSELEAEAAVLGQEQGVLRAIGDKMGEHEQSGGSPLPSGKKPGRIARAVSAAKRRRRKK